MSNPATHAAPPPPPQKMGLQPLAEDTALGLKPVTPGMVRPGDDPFHPMPSAEPILFSRAYGGRVAIPGAHVLYWLVRDGRLQPHPAFLYEPGILDPDKWSIAWIIAARSFAEMRDVPYSDVPVAGSWTWPDAAVEKTVDHSEAKVESVKPPEPAVPSKPQQTPQQKKDK